MSDEYLWDRTGEPDPDILFLEDSLRELGFHCDIPLEQALPLAGTVSTAPRWNAGIVGGVATLAAALTLWWCQPRMPAPPPNPPHEAAVMQPEEAPAWTEAVPDDRRATAREEQKIPPSVEPTTARQPVPSIEGEDRRPPSTENAQPDSPEQGVQASTTPGSEKKPRTRGSAGKERDSDEKPARKSTRETPQAPEGECITGECPVDDGGLPLKLSTVDVKNGINGIIEEAKACGPKHGATAGESVKVKFAIEGATGRVTDAVPLNPHVGTPLGDCVAAVAAKAQFRRFRSASMGVIYPFRMPRTTNPFD